MAISLEVNGCKQNHLLQKKTCLIDLTCFESNSLNDNKIIEKILFRCFMVKKVSREKSRELNDGIQIARRLKKEKQPKEKISINGLVITTA